MKKSVFVVGLIFLIIIFATPALIRGAMGIYLTNKLQAKLGIADNYRATIKSPIYQLLQGRIDSLQIIANNFKIKDNPNISKLKVDLFGVVVDLKQKRLKQVELTKFWAQIRQSDINEYMNLREKPLKNASLRFKNDKVYLTGQYGFLFSKINIQLETKLRISGGHRISADLDYLTLEKSKLPTPIVYLIEAWINPILDLNKERGSPSIEALSIRPGLLEVWGSLKITPEVLGN